MELRKHEGVKGKRDAYPFDPRLLTIDPQYNVRSLDSPDEREALDELKEQIREAGVRVPLEVRFDGTNVTIVAGHRRHKVVMELIDEGVPIETVLVIHEAKGTSEEERTLNLALSNSGRPLKPLEMAEIVRRLDAYGWDAIKIAKRLGWKSTASVKQHLDMLAMPAAVKQQVRQGDVSATTALKITKDTKKDARDDPEFAAKLIAANKAELKAAGVGQRKVTAKTLNRQKKNEGKIPVPTERAPRGQPHQPEPASEAAPQLARSDTAADTAANTTAAAPVADAQSTATPPLQTTNIAPQAASPLNGTKALIEAVEILVAYANENSLDHFRDEDIVAIPFFVGDVKRAIVAHAHALEAVTS